VAVINRQTTNAEIDELHRHGVRGIRLNLYGEGAMRDLGKQRELLTFYADRISKWKWSMAFLQLEPSHWEPLSELIPHLPVNVVVDHHALMKARSMLPAEEGQVLQQTGMAAIVKMLKGSNFWLKLSAPYRCSEEAPHYGDMEGIVRCLVDANPHRLVWGSDW